MAERRHPKTVIIPRDGDLTPSLGLLFVEELPQDAARPDCPGRLRVDWEKIAAWIGHSGGDLSDEQRQKVSAAFAAYMAVGVAPSDELQPIFDAYAADAPHQVRNKPPKEIMDVFDRMLATDDKIRTKRARDRLREFENISAIFESHTRQERGWWKSRSRIFKNCLFFSLVWIALSFAYAWIFDPFDVGGWKMMGEEEDFRLYAIASAPVVLGLIYAAYLRWVADN